MGGAIAFAAMKQDAARAEELLEGEVGGLENVACHKAALQEAVRYCGAFDDCSIGFYLVCSTHSVHLCMHVACNLQLLWCTTFLLLNARWDDLPSSLQIPRVTFLLSPVAES